MTLSSAPLVGLMGKKRAGKDTFAARLIEQHGFTRVAFADPLKEAALGLDPLVRVEQDEGGLFRETLLYPSRLALGVSVFRLSEVVDAVGWETAKGLREVRRTLQRYGVAIREIDPGFWLRVALERAEAADGPVVITDVRFPNEADAVEARGTLVRVLRPGLVSDDSHASEIALDDREADFVALNTGTVEDLAGYADALVSQITLR